MIKLVINVISAALFIVILWMSVEGVLHLPSMNNWGSADYLLAVNTAMIFLVFINQFTRKDGKDNS